jgi:hypothetical protein
MDYLKAFLIGGALCLIGQILIDKTKLTPARILTGYVVAGVFLGAVGIYEPLVKFAGAGASGADVYSTLILGDDAYGVTEIEGGGLEHIVKQHGSAGTADPLNQRATCGWKGTKVAELLVPQYIVRIETTATP